MDREVRKMDKMTAFRRGIDVVLNEVLPWEIGKLHKGGGDVYGLSVCVLAMLENDEAKRAQCGKWVVRRIDKNRFELEFRGEYEKPRSEKNESEKNKALR